MKHFSKLLVANRGEIACRVMRAARRLGIRTVAVYSDADADALHVESADESVRIGRSPAPESYLAAPAILEAAARTGADAVHPGYGFLSENAAFAQACRDAGLVFVGPPPAAIRALGDKGRAKRLAAEIGVPCIPGYQGESQDDATLWSEAQRIGFPLLIKAAAGGGGRGMRRVEREADWAASLAAARREAGGAFGAETVILEQIVEPARHVEIQFIADEHGHCLALGERDCSVQRRHQKVIEESPSPAATADLRRAMSEAAIAVALAAGYVNAGTVEFLVDAAGKFYFLEVNTRLQVEHPVTELVTGVDLVEWQLLAAQGSPLPLAQSDLRLEGHSIEARLYAEDPREGFRPQTGRVRDWRPPSGPGVRVDHGLRRGDVITPYYDPMIAKVVAHGETREAARARLVAALQETVLFGVTTNRDFLLRVLAHPEFASGRATTSFLDGAGLQEDDPTPPAEVLAAACVCLIEHAARDLSPGERGWRSTGPATTPIRLELRDQRWTFQIVHRGDRYTASVDGQSVEMEKVRYSGGRLEWTMDGRRRRADCLVEGDEAFLNVEGRTFAFRDATYAPALDAGATVGGLVRSPMSGRVLRTAVAKGDAVRKGDVLVVVEAMKMENHVAAPRDGRIEAVHAAAGDQVEANQILVALKVESEPPAGEGSKGT